jgi:Asp-tRNA(Asn)/Glu-tRNA(Gln) amidotransferase A subunit family amidase
VLETLTDWLKASAVEREAGVQAAIGRIRELDASIQAWTHVDPQPPTGDGPLSGIPFAAKDIFETRGLPTEYGSPIYQGRIGSEDAALVGRLRDCGAVLLGKTHTAAFAHRTPPPTRNPHNLEHTPGGSSSGSAAAVAAGMVPIALGTQTKGSVLRPASYCGVTGFKPTFGMLPMDGILPLSVSLDTPGFFTHTPADMVALWDVMFPATDNRQLTTRNPVFGVPNPVPDVEPIMAEAFHDAVSALRACGATIQPIDIASMLRTLCATNDTVMSFEGARFHHERYDLYGDRLDDLVTLVRRGLLVSSRKYQAAQELIERCRATIAGIYEATPVILLPAATGPAPRGLASTGDARMNAPWTTLGTPAISIPLPAGNAMPLGLQLTAPRGEDAMLLRTAAGVHAMLGAATA